MATTPPRVRMRLRSDVPTPHGYSPGLSDNQLGDLDDSGAREREVSGRRATVRILSHKGYQYWGQVPPVSDMRPAGGLTPYLSVCPRLA